MPNAAEPDSPEFFGVFKCAVEDSGRLMIPAKFRLKEPYSTYRMISSPVGVDHCLLVFSPWSWSRFIETIRSKPEARGNPEEWQRVLARAGDAVSLDKVGRIVLRDDLIASAGIKKEAVLRGRLATFEIWSPERFEQFGGEDPRRAADLVADIIP